MQVKFIVNIFAYFLLIIAEIHVECVFLFPDFYNEMLFFNPRPDVNSTDDGINNQPLYLTPYIDDGNITEAKRTAYVPPLVTDLVGDIVSYSGFLTVNKSYNTNLFFWFFVNEKNISGAPLLLWLQGNPGESFLVSLFDENGPYMVVDDNTIKLRNYSWTKDFNVLYIDNPVGAGFSFTEDENGYSRTAEDAASNLYNAMIQFYQLFGEFLDNELFLTGESYAAKYIVAFASLINEHNLQEQNKLKINLKGLFIGCGFIDPVNQMYYADYLFYEGIVDTKTRESIAYYEKIGRNYIKENNYYRAQHYFSFVAYEVYWAGYFPPVDVLNTSLVNTNDHLWKYVQSINFRQAVHVGLLTFHDKEKVLFHFRDDIFQSVGHYLSELLDNYKVLLYSGQFDMFLPHIQFERVISELQWNKADLFLRTDRKNWYVEGELAGYKKIRDNLQYVMVRNTNHFALKHQPERIYELLKYFVEGS